jgi:hypothetical protein
MMPAVEQGQGRRALIWLYDQINVALWAIAFALLLLFIFELPTIYREADRVRQQRADELQSLYRLYCTRMGFTDASPQFQRCTDQLAELADAIRRKDAEDADF